MSLKILILAGGSGTRLWPLSRKKYPKQFLKMDEFNGTSFFEQTINRAKKITSKENIFIVTNIDYKFHCMNQSDIREENILIEPVAKNTLGAITLGIEKAKDDDVFLVLSSDQIIKNDELFITTTLDSLKSTDENIVLFGVKPNCPHTGYGYIEAEKTEKYPTQVKKFKEKPNLETAQEYVNNGYFWNAGIFMFKKSVFIEELKKSSPEYFEIIQNGVLENFSKLPDLSVDYGVLERSQKITMSPLNLYWSDLGSFDSFDTYFTENNIEFEITSVNANNNRVISENKEKVYAFNGVDDVIIVDTKDACLVMKKGTSQDIKSIINSLKNEKNYTVDYGVTVYRPWGSYTIIDEGVGFKTKRLTVLPGKKLSSQIHHHRSEHWVIVSGTAKITLDDQEILLSKGQGTYISIGTKHRLENIGKVDLHIIESQIGDYLEEDDIIRFDDDFGRV